LRAIISGSPSMAGGHPSDSYGVAGQPSPTRRPRCCRRSRGRPSGRRSPSLDRTTRVNPNAHNERGKGCPRSSERRCWASWPATESSTVSPSSMAPPATRPDITVDPRRHRDVAGPDEWLNVVVHGFVLVTTNPQPVPGSLLHRTPGIRCAYEGHRRRVVRDAVSDS
jgi:hypothetical protein